MKIIITEEQLKLIIESGLKSHIQGIEYLPGENVEYSTIRRIGKYLVDKDLIENLLSKSMKYFLSRHGRSFIDCEESKFDVILDTCDAILHYYEDSWAEDEEGDVQEELADVFDQIRGFLDDMYGQKIEEYCRTIEL